MRVARLLSVCAFVGLVAPGSAHADPASPTDVDAARAHYKRGVQLFEDKKYEEALVELERANSLAPTYRLLYNIALVQQQLGDVAGALRSFGSYLDAGAEVPAARRAEVQRTIAALMAKVATVTVTSSVPGAEITVDERVAGTTPLAAPLRLNAGPHHLGASKAGYRAAMRALDVVGGDRVEIPFSLEELPPPEPPPPPPPPPPEPEVVPPPPPPAPPPIPLPPPPERRVPPTWIGWTVTGALATGAVVTGVAALSSSHALSGDVADHATPADTLHAAHDTTVTLAAVSDVLTGMAVAAAGVTLYLTIASRRPSASSATRSELRAGPGSVWLSTTF